MLGRHLERKREIESHFRAQKIEIYDEMLSELFKLFASGEKEQDSADGSDNEIVEFLREWQKKMVLWGGAPVLAAYIAWSTNLKQGKVNAQTVFLMDEFFRAMRKDIGLSNSNLKKGVFSHFLFRHAEHFLDAAKSNPDITLVELAKLEKEKGLE